ncbi:NACHT domain-containing protein [Nostoc sp. UCD121]|uniref:NACHT domain-containing protein n=1 Tax=unclassified Nostoc TaxID=2593658 RepID=UPI00162477B1|nr:MULTISPECIES: NACHT domain-containing protein [unclassified Nostoc]MBC1218656.1 NACHT domain-containing protein [Nostoc sp. UCD120]MBC1274890.1 NACHT domain-containing protein [Nostoc sp. UCD121]MBC1293600.1 NACHT domain-containing protein [Nostoc sp. UCD122]
MIINPEQVISAIIAIANPLIKEKIQRNETVIKLLQQFKLDPEHPPADFSGVYAYSLVEYGVGKPKPCLELFRQEAIKQAFRKAFDHNNPSILLSEVDAWLDAYSLGDDIRSLGIDIRREVAAFYIVFAEVAKRTRNPADTLMSQQIGSLQKRIANIQELLDRLPTLEGIRTEIARLAEQSSPALLPTETSTENKCRAIALAQQMRGWFETLGYRFEKYEIWGDSYFEWIINVPTRRNRYDRILIRGIEGEVGLKDVAVLRSSVEQQRTDEGWLVTARRIARAARNEVEKEENRHLGCYTFDELIDQDADFSDYLDWLEAEIIRRQIDTKYVPLACTKEEIDPDTKQRIGISHYSDRDGWIDGYIDMWLDDPAKEHISILGEFGTGKTWFAFHYAWVALQRYRDAQKRGVERPRLPLVITLRDFAKAINVENVLAGFFFTQHNIRLTSEVFDQLNQMGKLLLIFDGFDEMAAKVDRQQMINNFWELAKVVVPGAKVVLTCRTEHFPDAKEGRALLNAELQASTKQLTGETPQFEVLELEKFNDEQIRLVLSHQTGTATVEQVMGNPQLLDLARRPVMTELILEALPDIEAGKPVDMSRVYLYAVRRKMERDIKSDRTFTSLAEKLYFLCELSWEMLSTDKMSLNYRLFPERIRRLFGSVVQEEKDLDHWHYDMMAQTMLVRNADGDYTPAHRSLLEFFVAYKFAAELGALASDFTELAQAQSGLDSSAVPVDYTWSGYFARKDNIIAPLKAFTSESFEKLRETFGKAPLTKAVMDLLVPMLGDNDSLIKVIEATRFRSEDEVGYVGGNAATLAVKIDKGALEGRDLSGTLIKGTDFSNARLQSVNFAEANLANCAFTQALGAVFSVTYSPDGKLLATGDGNGVVRLLETATYKEILTCKGHGSMIPSIAFSPSDQILASGGYDRTIKLWCIQTGECLNTLQGNASGISSIAFSPSGRLLTSNGNENIIRLWNVDTGESLTAFHGHSDYIRSVAFDPSGMMLVSASEDKTIRIWDINSGKCLKILDGHTDGIRSIALNSTGEIIASSSSDSTIRLWNIKTGKCLNILQGHTSAVMSVVFSNCDQIIVSGGGDQTVRLWDVQTGKCLNIIQGHTNIVRSIAFHPSSQTFASGSYDKTVKIWDINTCECLKTVQGHANWISSVAFSPSGQTLASGGNDATVIWNANTGKCLRTLQLHTDWVFSVAFSPCGKVLASSGADAKVRLWNIETGECLTILYGHTDWIFSVVFSPDGKLLASSGVDKKLKLWSIETGKCLTTINGDPYTVRSVAFNPVDGTLASGGSDSKVKLWDVNTGECLKILQGHSGTIRSVDFHPGGKTLASASSDYTVRLWDVDTGECFKILPGHSNGVQEVAFSADGQILATASEDSTVKLWHIPTGECFQTLCGHTAEVFSVSFNPDGKTLISGSQDETINIWDVVTGECLKTLRSDRPYERMNITGIKGLIPVEIATLKALGAIEDGK